MKQFWIILVLILASSSHAKSFQNLITQNSHPSAVPQTKRYPIESQNNRFPLGTQFSPEEIKAFNEIFEWGETFNKAKVIELRQKLQNVAEHGDVIGQYYLARTYDLYPYGIGDPNDAKVALQWYLKAANQNFAIAEKFLYTTYRYSLMGIPKDNQKAFSWLIRSQKHASGGLASDIALEFARIYDPQLDTVYRIEGIQPNQNQSNFYLEEAFKLDPNNQTAIDWWGSVLIEQNRYQDAILVLSRSENSNEWPKLAEIYENGQGVRKNYVEAAKWYQKATAVAVAERKAIISKEDDVKLRNSTIRDFNKRELFWFASELYRMYCQKKITVDKMGEFYSPIAYREFLKFQNNCVLPRGG